jgi:ABC-2 type transport system ATP-binding protein
MDTDIAIKVEGVYKEFHLPHEKAGSVKNIFTNLMGYIRKRRTFETQHALRDVSFEIKKGEFFGIVGRNGSGKSTLLKMLAGIYQPTKGSLRVEGKLVPFIELGVGFNPELTGRENIFLNGALMGFSQKEVQAMYEEIVEFAELERFMDQKLKNYSSGMQVRLAFSLAIRAETDILLIDEVLAVGDADFQKKCFKYFKNLKQQNKTVVFVSHDMHAVEEYCDRAILIEESKVVVRGSSREVAASYTRMFLEQDNGHGELKNKKKRWGNNAIKYEHVSVVPKKLDDSGHFKISTVAKVYADIEEGVFGFSVRGEDDKRLLGTNNKLKKKRLVNLKKGDRINIEWQTPNILNTGNYVIDVAIQNEDYSEVYDWWEDAAQILVERSDENSYPTHPIIEVNIAKEE